MIRLSPPGAFRRPALHFVLAAVVAASACGDDTTTPTEPDPVSITETFAGTLTPNDAESHPFSSQRGTVTATLLSITPDPDSTATIGFSLGTWNGLLCAVVLSNDKAISGTSIIGTVNGTGNLCVRMFDIGTIAQPLAYEVRVIHF
jgi:hypothetical protein